MKVSKIKLLNRTILIHGFSAVKTYFNFANLHMFTGTNLQIPTHSGRNTHVKPRR
jgi:hypothetical protein